MRICSPQLGISPDSHLGGEVYDRHILMGLAKAGMKVEILLPEGMRCDPQQDWIIHRTPRHRFNYYEYNWIFLSALYRLYQTNRFDLLRVHSPTIGLACWWFHQTTHVPVIAHYHHLEENRIADWINRLVICNYNVITTDSQFSSNQLVHRYRLSKENIRIVYPGVDPIYVPSPGIADLKNRLGISGAKVLFYLGSLKERKNLPFLLHVFKEVHQAEPNSRLILGGSGPLAEELKALAAKLGITSYIQFTGPIQEEEKAVYYSLADVFVMPSLVEGFGLAAAEAMACSTATVVSNTSSLPEVVQDGITGFLADPSCVEEFKAKILILFKDDALRTTMGRAGREKVLDKFSWDRAAMQTKEIYEQVLQSSKMDRNGK